MALFRGVVALLKEAVTVEVDFEVLYMLKIPPGVSVYFLWPDSQHAAAPSPASGLLAYHHAPHHGGNGPNF